MTIGVGIFGAGMFVRDEHLPAVLKNKNLSLRAIYSRTEKTARTLIEDAKLEGVELFSGDNGIEKLLARSDIQAVIVAVPISHVPAIVKKSLLAGKHVLSEKPIAKDVATSRDLIEFHRNNTPNLVYAVAENFRYLDAVREAKKLLKSYGKITTFLVQVHQFMDQENKWYLSPWRTVPDYQGGFILDGGVHFIAALREALDVPVERVSAFGSQNLPYLPPIDTLNATVLLKNGATGIFSVSFGTSKSEFDIIIEAENGYVTIAPNKLTYKKRTEETIHEISYKDAVPLVQREVDSFTEALLTGKQDPLQDPVAAFEDIAFIEQALKSAEQNGASLEIPSV
jgi:predicted dehydrogenase